MTNEQSVIQAEDKIAQLKNNYIAFLTPIALRVQENIPPSLEELLRCQQLGNEYFNYLENFVGNSGLLGAHANGKWVTGFAETCHSVLNAYIVHINFLRSHKSVFNGTNFEPDELAFANMQRMVKEYLPKEIADSLENSFIINQLPTKGFNIFAHPNKSKTPTWQIITSIVIGLLCIVSVVLLSLFIPNPTEWQGFVFRGCFALGLAAVAIIVPGFLNIDTHINGLGNYIKIVAGGAMAIFVLIWLVNPPSVKTSDTNTTIEQQDKSLVAVRIKHLRQYQSKKIYDKETNQYFYTTRFKVILSNNGSANTSIIGCEIYLKTDLEQQEKKSLYIWMAHFKPKFFQLDEKNFAFPININAGQSLAFFMDINLQNISSDSDNTNYVIRFEKANGSNIEALFSPQQIVLRVQGEK